MNIKAVLSCEPALDLTGQLCLTCTLAGDSVEGELIAGGFAHLCSSASPNAQAPGLCRMASARLMKA